MKFRFAVAALFLIIAAQAFCADIVDVYVDGAKKHFKPAARVVAGKTYAPLRATAESFGGEVTWYEDAKLASICRGSSCVPIRQDQGIIVDNQLLIPLRLLGEALGADVKWDAQNKAVRIKSPPSF